MKTVGVSINVYLHMVWSILDIGVKSEMGRTPCVMGLLKLTVHGWAHVSAHILANNHSSVFSVESEWMIKWHPCSLERANTMLHTGHIIYVTDTLECPGSHHLIGMIDEH